MKEEKIRTRIAPSPTGMLHIGTARTALFSYLYAKHNGGEFVIRIEDTDKARNDEKYEKDILNGINWLGLKYDEFYKQSDNIQDHKDAIRQLIESGSAYISKEPAKDDPNKEVEVVRLRNKGEEVTFKDIIRGEITFDTTELGDFVIARSVDEPLYHLAVVVDDKNESITHIIRGEDHISNTPRQILIQRALKYSEPKYAHIPLTLAPDKSKLSKRRHANFAIISNLRERGFLSEALINFMALLGWSTGDDREIFSLEELVAEFELGKMQKSNAVFNIDKLRWINREYMLKMNSDDFSEKCINQLSKSLPNDGHRMSIIERLVPIVKERISVWGEIQDMAEKGEFDYFFEAPKIDKEKIAWKDDTIETAKKHLRAVCEMLDKLADEDFSDPEKIKNIVWEYAEREGRGSVLWPLRFALTGRQKSPDPFMVASVLGKEDTLNRILHIFQYLV